MSRPWRGLAAVAADADTATEALIEFNTPEWEALKQWCEFHAIDPHAVLAGTRISRDECGRCIRYVGLVLDDQGRKQYDGDPELGRIRTAPMVEQGEAPPLPFPDSIAALLRPSRPSTPETT
ncbi:hypothetical protein [Nocardioides lacusdianchii]|uniref:hypothetical protein n=1 Tax=Nocardioides lacusdianchii TaxID=2783664 RepID=UPI001CCD6CE7|nr:hypothetical protein [Nocardioides lacusdianchii]